VCLIEKSNISNFSPWGQLTTTFSIHKCPLSNCSSNPGFFAFNGEGGYKSGDYTILEALPAYRDHHSDLPFYAPFLKMVWW